MYCKNCGNEVGDDSRFCRECGGVIKERPGNQTAADGGEPYDIEGEVPWGVADTLKALLISFGLQLVAVMLLFLIFRNPLDFTFILLSQLVASSLTLAMIWVFAIRKYKAPFSSLGLRFSFSVGQFFLVILAWVIALGLSAAYDAFLYTLTKERPPIQPILEIFGENIVLAYIVIVIVAPITEEIFFRGFLYAAFRDKLGVTYGVIISAAIFGAVHAMPLIFFPLFIIGVALAILYEQKRSLVAPILMHAINNAMALTVLYIYNG